MTNIAIENGHGNSDCSHWKWLSSIAMLSYHWIPLNVENPCTVPSSKHPWLAFLPQASTISYHLWWCRFQQNSPHCPRSPLRHPKFHQLHQLHHSSPLLGQFHQLHQLRAGEEARNSTLRMDLPTDSQGVNLHVWRPRGRKQRSSWWVPCWWEDLWRSKSECLDSYLYVWIPIEYLMDSYLIVDCLCSRFGCGIGTALESGSYRAVPQVPCCAGHPRLIQVMDITNDQRLMLILQHNTGWCWLEHVLFSHILGISSHLTFILSWCWLEHVLFSHILGISSHLTFILSWCWLEHVLFSHILGIIIPIGFHICQRGRYNHQPEYIFYLVDE